MKDPPDHATVDRTITTRIAIEGGDMAERQPDRLSETLRRLGDCTAGAVAVVLSPTLGSDNGGLASPKSHPSR